MKVQIFSIRGHFILIYMVFFFQFTTGCASNLLQAKSPDVIVTNVTPLESTLFEQRLQIDLRVRNPNDFDLEVTGLDFQLALNGQKFATGLANHGVTIPRLGEAVLSVMTTASTLNVLQQLLKLRKGQDVTYQVTGILHLQEIPLPFKKEGVLIQAKQLSGIQSHSRTGHESM